MIKITSITMKNFLSVGNVTMALNLDMNGLTLVLGANTDTNGGLTRNGAGKAQSLDCKVKTPWGWTRMGDIRVGDLVSTPSGRTARVNGVFPQGSIPVFKMTFSDGRSTEACGDHIWKTWSRNGGEWKWSTKTTAQVCGHIDGTSSRRAYIPLLEADNVPDQDLPLDPRLMGLLLGDGNLTGLSMSSQDQEIINYIRNKVPKDYTLTQTSAYDYRLSRGKGKKGHDCRLRQVLAFYGLNKTKSETKFIPNAYKQGSIQQRIDLLSGLIDTDGYVGKHGDISYTTVSKQLCEDFVEVVRSIGGIATVRERTPTFTYKGQKKQGRKAYTVRVRYRDPKRLVCLQRKRDRISENYQYANTLRLEIVDVKPVGVKPAQCISIDDPEHLYITDDYIVTHNTTILQAISFALYGKALSKIKIPNLVNNINNKGMLVTIEYEKDGLKYRVERGRKPDIMRYFIDGKEVKEEDAGNNAQGENLHTQTEIERVIGMSYTMFKHIVALNTYTDPFLRMRVSDQREVIEELLGVTQISQRAEVLKKLSGQTKEKLRDEQARIRAVADANQRIENAITQAETLSAKWVDKHENTLATLIDEIETMSNINYEAEIAAFDALDQWVEKDRDLRESVSSAKRDISHYQREIRAIEDDAARFTREAKVDVSTQVRRLEDERKRKTAEHARVQDQRSTDLEEVSKLQYQIDNPDHQICVCCNQTLAGTDHLNTVIDNLKKSRDKLLKKTDKDDLLLVALAKESASIKDEIDTLTRNAEARKVEFEAKAAKRLKEAKEPRERLSVQEGLLETFSGLLAAFSERPDTLFGSRDEVYRARQLYDKLVHELDVERERHNPHAAQADSFRDALQEIDYTTINELDLLLKHQDFLLKLLTSKDSFIRKKIIDQNLAYLNTRLNYYLEKLGLPHEVKFQSDLSVEILLLGRDFDFEQLSRGEMNRVIMATSWSFRDVWESLNDTFNLLFVDEMLDQGTDSQGVEAALGVLKSMARDRNKNVFLISHRDDLTARIDRILLVRKENGFTRFEEDAVV